MMKLFAIAFGGSIGALLRYFISNLANQSFKTIGFPIGTLLVNSTGCFIGGIIIGSLAPKLSNDLKAFIIFGILGSYTTFSSFGIETITLIQEDKVKSAIIYIASTFILTLAGVIVGYTLSKKFLN